MPASVDIGFYGIGRRTRGVSLVLLGHTQDDQLPKRSDAEFVKRVPALTAWQLSPAPCAVIPGDITFLRPFLLIRAGCLARVFIGAEVNAMDR